MTNFFSKLFGGATPKAPVSPVEEDPVAYGEYSIISVPEKTDDGHWRLSGQIEKIAGEIAMTRAFVRVDTFPSREQAVEFTLRKGKQIIDQQGDLLFENGEATGRA